MKTRDPLSRFGRFSRPSTWLAAMIAVASLGLAGMSCEKKSPMEEAVDDAKEAAEDAADAVGDAAEEVADEVDDAVNE